MSTAHVVAEARALAERFGARRAAAALARTYGLGVFEVLNRFAAKPEIHALLDLPPRREAHRPRGSTSRDLVAWALAEVHDGLHMLRADLLRALGRNPASATGPFDERRETKDSKWFRRTLTRGRAFRNQPSAVETSPDAATITFLSSYGSRLSPQARLALVIPFLLDATPNADHERAAAALNALVRG